MGQLPATRALGPRIERVVGAFSKLHIRESPRLCSIYLHDVVNFLPRETCGGLRLVSGRLDDELSSYPSSRLPRKVLRCVKVTTNVSLRRIKHVRDREGLH